MITDNLSKETIEEYLTYCNQSHENIKEIIEKENHVETIGVLIEEYEATKLTLANLEYQYEINQLHYQEQFHILKTKYMYEGMKSTEAKENANQRLVEQKMEQVEIEREIALLKANIHSLEYQFRLKFLMYKDIMGLTYSDIMEGGEV